MVFVEFLGFLGIILIGLLRLALIKCIMKVGNLQAPLKVAGFIMALRHMVFHGMA